MNFLKVLTLTATMLGMIFISHLGMAQSKSSVAIYKKMESKAIPEYCAKKFAGNKGAIHKCEQKAVKLIKDDCGNKPWEDCFFDYNKMTYMNSSPKARNKNWVEMIPLFNKQIK